MESTNSRIAQSIVTTLREHVLPELSGGWAASYARSALVLLTLLDYRLRFEEDIIARDNVALCALVETLSNGIASYAPHSPQVAAGRAALATAPSDPATLNLRMRLVLDELIVAVYSRRDPERRNLVAKLAEYRAGALERTEVLWQAAAELPVM